MATQILQNCKLWLGGYNLTGYMNAMGLEYGAEMLDDTVFGDDTKSSKGGLKNWSAEVEFHQDYASGSVDATLFSIVGSTVAVVIRPVKATAVGPTNPNYTGNGTIESYNPMGGAVGELASASVSIQCAGTLSRATA